MVTLLVPGKKAMVYYGWTATVQSWQTFRELMLPSLQPLLHHRPDTKNAIGRLHSQEHRDCPKLGAKISHKAL
jgi:hypothetical protein